MPVTEIFFRHVVFVRMLDSFARVVLVLGALARITSSRFFTGLMLEGLGFAPCVLTSSLLQGSVFRSLVMTGRRLLAKGAVSRLDLYMQRRLLMTGRAHPCCMMIMRFDGGVMAASRSSMALRRRMSVVLSMSSTSCLHCMQARNASRQRQVNTQMHRVHKSLYAFLSRRSLEKSWISTKR